MLNNSVRNKYVKSYKHPVYSEATRWYFDITQANKSATYQKLWDSMFIIFIIRFDIFSDKF